VKDQVDTAWQINPTHIDTIVLKASLLAYQGKQDEAISMLQKALKKNLANSDSILLLSRLYRHQKLDQKAEKLLKDGTVILPGHIGIRLELAKFYESHKQLDDAVKIMQEIITLDPALLNHRQTLAYYYIRQQKPEKAEQTYQQAIEFEPNDTTRYFAYSDFIKQQKSLSAAIDYLKKNINNVSNADKEISFKLVSFYQEAGEIDQAIAVLENIVKSSKLDLSAMRARKKLMSAYLTKNDIDTTKRLIEEILLENPKDHDAILLKGKILKHEKNYDLAITLLRTALKNQSDSIEILHLLSETHLLNGEIHLAAKLLKQAIKINPANVGSYLQLARFMLASGEDVHALEQVNHALEIEPENIKAIILKTDVLMHQKKIEEVIPLLDTLKKLAPDNAEGWFRMGRVYKLLNKKERARQEFISAFSKAPDSDDLLAELTDIEIELGQIKATKERLQNIIKQQPEHSTAHKFLAMAYLAEKKPDSAEKEFILHLQQSPGDVTALIQLANIQFSRKNINQAAEYYLRAGKIAPENIEILMNLAQIRLIQRQYDNAISLYEKVLAIQPDDAAVTNNLAMILVNNKSDPDSLLRAKKLIQNSKVKNHPALQDTLGWLYFHQGEYDNAHSALEKAITQAPDIPTFHYHMGMVYLKKASNDLAIKHLEKALSLGNFPERSRVSRALAHLKDISSK
ncbi:MAG: tetratricopeptide repeat protein, partial [Gammaproteobacteria bacterium]|nr:tetratricopeptide repeat protein [Gammaproteobacteria bacterium]